MANSVATSAQARSGARRRRQTQAQIVEATRQLLNEGVSLSDISVEQLASAAGVSRATMYLHFKDKNAVIARAVHDFVENRFTLGTELIADPGLGKEGVRAILAAMLSRWIADAPLLRAVIELAERDDDIRAIWMDAIHEVGAQGAALMGARWADGLAAPTDPDTVGEILAWMFERTAHQLTRDPERSDTVLDGLTEVVWRVLDYRPVPRASRRD